MAYDRQSKVACDSQSKAACDLGADRIGFFETGPDRITEIDPVYRTGSQPDRISQFFKFPDHTGSLNYLGDHFSFTYSSIVIASVTIYSYI